MLEGEVYVGRVLGLNTADNLQKLLLGVLLIGLLNIRPVGQEAVEPDLYGLEVGEVGQEVADELLRGDQRRCSGAHPQWANICKLAKLLKLRDLTEIKF